MGLIAKIIENVFVNSKMKRLVVLERDVSMRAVPGQFVHLRIASGYDPLLRRPFGIHKADKQAGTISILYEIRGRGTSILAEMNEGDAVDIIGPLGNGFRLPDIDVAEVIVVGGGIGVAPLLYLALEIRRQISYANLIVILGATTRDTLACREEFIDIADKVLIATDDGSEGCCGYVTVPLSQCLDMVNNKKTIIYACGPTEMLKAVAHLADNHDVLCQVSTEAKMACGVGACMGCVIKTRSAELQGFEYKRCCVDGPVFDASEVLWE